MNNQTNDVLSWLNLTATGPLGLTPGLNAAQVQQALGDTQRSPLPTPGLVSLGHTPLPTQNVNATVACVLDREQLMEVRVELWFYDRAALEALHEVLALKLNAFFPGANGASDWQSGTTQVGLNSPPPSLSPEDTAEALTLTWTWDLGLPERPSPQQTLPPIAWDFVFADDGQGQLTPGGARLGEAIEAYEYRHEGTQRRNGRGALGVQCTEAEGDRNDRLATVILDASGKGEGYAASVALWQQNLSERFGPADAKGHSFTWGDQPARATLEHRDLGRSGWFVSVTFTQA